MAVAIETNPDGTLRHWSPAECRQFVAEQEAEWRKGARLRPHEVKEIRGMLRIGMTHRQIASLYGVAASTVTAIATGAHFRDRETA